MNIIQFKDACSHFMTIAAPYLDIKDEAHYQEALELIESLMGEVEEDADHPMDVIISLLANAISEYESHNSDINDFEKNLSYTTGIEALRVLMEQHQLGVSDLPEIGSKSMVSRVLSGERNLSKKHIENISQRFNIDAGLFFR